MVFFCSIFHFILSIILFINIINLICYIYHISSQRFKYIHILLMFYWFFRLCYFIQEYISSLIISLIFLIPCILRNSLNFFEIFIFLHYKIWYILFAFQFFFFLIYILLILSIKIIKYLTLFNEIIFMNPILMCTNS